MIQIPWKLILHQDKAVLQLWLVKKINWKIVCSKVLYGRAYWYWISITTPSFAALYFTIKVIVYESLIASELIHHLSLLNVEKLVIWIRPIRGQQVWGVFIFRSDFQIYWSDLWIMLSEQTSPIVWVKTNDNNNCLFYNLFWPFFCQLYVYLSQKGGSDSHFEVLNWSKYWFVQTLGPQM